MTESSAELDSTGRSDGTDPSAGAEGDSRSRRGALSITMQGLHKRFGRAAVALAGVDLTIEAGEFFTLLGPSGCGKTTLLRILAGLEDADEGQLSIGGRDVTEVPPHQRSVNTVFQSYALFPHLSVRENLAFGLKMRGIPVAQREQKVAEIAEFIKLGDLLDRRIGQLSGGQRQRIALARALVCEPEVLLLDEPLSALDAGLRSQLQVELLRVQKHLGMTFVFVTHDQDEAMVMSDRIAVLDGGRIQQVGTPAEVYEYPANAFVARFMGHENLVAITAADEGWVDTELGRVQLEASQQRAEQQGFLLIRPETFEFDSSNIPDSYNRFEAVVREKLYRGSRIEYRIEIQGQLLSAVASNLGQRLHEVGDVVDVGVCPEDLVRVAS